MNEAILKFLKTNGHGVDAEIARALRIPISQVTYDLSQLSMAGAIVCCDTIQYINGKEMKGIGCRLSGSLPVSARGPKIGVKPGVEDVLTP